MFKFIYNKFMLYISPQPRCMPNTGSGRTYGHFPINYYIKGTAGLFSDKYIKKLTHHPTGTISVFLSQTPSKQRLKRYPPPGIQGVIPIARFSAYPNHTPRSQTLVPAQFLSLLFPFPKTHLNCLTSDFFRQLWNLYKIYIYISPILLVRIFSNSPPFFHFLTHTWSDIYFYHK